MSSCHDSQLLITITKSVTISKNFRNFTKRTNGTFLQIDPLSLKCEKSVTQTATVTLLLVLSDCDFIIRDNMNHHQEYIPSIYLNDNAYIVI